MSGSRQTSPLFYPIRQLHHVCRVDAADDVQAFRPLRPGLDPPEIVVLLLAYSAQRVPGVAEYTVPG